MAEELGKDVVELHSVARECLLYGMNLTRTPGALKREIKKLKGPYQEDLKAFSKSVTEDWSGNAYLLLVVPRVVVDRQAKIPDLEDFLFIRQFLTEDHLEELKRRVQNIPSITVDEIMEGLAPEVRKVSWKGRFLPQCDDKFENLKDVFQDLTGKSLVVLNKEFTNFKTHDPDKIHTYISYCLSGKAKTHFRAEAPRVSKVRVEKAQELEDLQSQSLFHAGIQDSGVAFSSIEFRQDIEKLLSKKQRDAVFLLLDMAEPELGEDFEVYLDQKGADKTDLTPTQLKRYISSFLEVDVFEALKNSSLFKDYLLYG